MALKVVLMGAGLIGHKSANLIQRHCARQPSATRQRGDRHRAD